MALTTPDDAYIDVSAADTYHTDRNNSTWTSEGDTAKKEAALREASMFLDNAYQWRGEHPGGAGQLRAWPRNNVIDTEGRHRSGIPQEIKDATAELALLALNEPLRPAQDRGGKIKRVEAGSVSVEYDESAPSHRTFATVDLIVSTLRQGSRGTIKLIRT